MNLILLLMSIGAVAAAVLTALSDGFRAGTDDLFFVLVCLLLALLFAVSPIMTAFEKGWIPNPFKSKEPAAAKK